MTNRVSITYNNTNKCSGSCLYCIAAATNHYQMGVNKKDIITSLIDTDNKNYDTFRADFNALENTLDNHPLCKGKSLTVDIWGADPLTNFQCLQEVVDFLEWYGNNKGKKITISTSTNGLPFLRDDIVEYLYKHKLGVQLSHDGLGQWIRTGDVDPMDWDITHKLIGDGVVRSINATLSFWNYSIFDNIKYFSNHLMNIFPKVYSTTEMATEKDSRIFRSLYIKLNHIMDGEYDVKGKHKDYDIPLGDMSFHNDRELADKLHDESLAHVLDNYLYEWDIWYEMTRFGKNNTPYYLPFKKYLDGQLTRGGNIPQNGGGNCRKYQIGAIDYSEHIDTLGKYTDCNLQDSDHPVPNRANELKDFCSTCKYKNSGECNMCGAVPKRSKCEYLYRWNQFLDKTRNTKYAGSKSR